MAHGMLQANVASLTLDEALFAAGGLRSILGVLKHVGAWAHVYRSYAFDADPKHWAETSWPRGLRDEVVADRDYLDEVIAWIDEALAAWDRDLQSASDEDPRRVHWGETMPLFAIACIQANHLAYHAGELNMLLSIARREAWELGEEVEENHISTFGHAVRGPWMNDAQFAWYQERVRAAHEARTGGEAVAPPA